MARRFIITDRQLTLDDAIAHIQETADKRTDFCEECRSEYRQIAEWLRDYKRMTEEKSVKASSEVNEKQNIVEVPDYYIGSCNCCGNMTSKGIKFCYWCGQVLERSEDE